MPAKRRMPQLPPIRTTKLPPSKYYIEIRKEQTRLFLEVDSLKAGIKECEKFAELNPEAGIYLHRYRRDDRPAWMKWPSDRIGRAAD